MPEYVFHFERSFQVGTPGLVAAACLLVWFIVLHFIVLRQRSKLGELEVDYQITTQALWKKSNLLRAEQHKSEFLQTELNVSRALIRVDPKDFRTGIEKAMEQAEKLRDLPEGVDTAAQVPKWDTPCKHCGRNFVDHFTPANFCKHTLSPDGELTVHGTTFEPVE
jgi:hypothetical protein